MALYSDTGGSKQPCLDSKDKIVDDVSIERLVFSMQSHLLTELSDSAGINNSETEMNDRPNSTLPSSALDNSAQMKMEKVNCVHLVVSLCLL